MFQLSKEAMHEADVSQSAAVMHSAGAHYMKHFLVFLAQAARMSCCVDSIEHVYAQ